MRGRDRINNLIHFEVNKIIVRFPKIKFIFSIKCRYSLIKINLFYDTDYFDLYNITFCLHHN